VFVTWRPGIHRCLVKYLLSGDLVYTDVWLSICYVKTWYTPMSG
jgi:hypothetical protein